MRDSLEETPEKSSVTPSDMAVILRIRESDEAAFAELVRTYATPLARFAYTYVGTVELAEDLVDDVFVWIWENRLTWGVTSSIRSYLFSATRNRALNSRRNESYRTAWLARHSGQPGDAGVPSGLPEVGAELETEELGVLLRHAIATLSENRRTALTLRWMNEMSYAEIAEIMQVSVIAVKQLLNRALRDLRERLPDYLNEP